MILVADLDILRHVLIKDSYVFINRRVWQDDVFFFPMH